MKLTGLWRNFQDLQSVHSEVIATSFICWGCIWLLPEWIQCQIALFLHNSRHVNPLEHAVFQYDVPGARVQQMGMAEHSITQQGLPIASVVWQRQNYTLQCSQTSWRTLRLSTPGQGFLHTVHCRCQLASSGHNPHITGRTGGSGWVPLDTSPKLQLRQNQVPSW